jgi:hypothetical protein
MLNIADIFFPSSQILFGNSLWKFYFHNALAKWNFGWRYQMKFGNEKKLFLWLNQKRRIITEKITFSSIQRKILGNDTGWIIMLF